MSICTRIYIINNNYKYLLKTKVFFADLNKNKKTTLMFSEWSFLIDFLIASEKIACIYFFLHIIKA